MTRPKGLESGALQTEDATDYRSIAARLNFLAQDRIDVQYVPKDIAKHMAKPMSLDWSKILRVARYLLGAPRYVQRYEWQHQETRVDAYADSDCPGDRVNRKSTSGGALMIGGHMIKSWSTTQPVIALSPGEAELYSLVKAAAQAKGVASLMLDFDLSVEFVVRTESTAAVGIVHRKCFGKVRNIEV